MITKPKPERRIPGPARGDLVLEKDALPDVIGPWHCAQFRPALPPEQLPEKQFWWTHSWLYANDWMTAYVAFDQADWLGWHELTVCYQAGGWIVANRMIIESEDVAWPVVVANLNRLPGEKATLIFSLFDQDGSPVPSPYTGIPPKKMDPAEGALLADLARRFADQPQANSNPIRPKTYTRIMQCQCLLQHPQELTQKNLQELIALHLETCAGLRTAWLQSQSETAHTVSQTESVPESDTAHP